MTTFGELNPQAASIIISIVLLLVVIATFMFIISITEKMGKGYVIVGGGILLFEYFGYFALYKGYYKIGTKYFPFIFYVVENTPAMLIILLTAGIEVFVVLWSISFFSWNKKHITLTSVKDAINDMEAGIVCSNEIGVPVMVNLNMEKMSEYITGKPIMNANVFWDDLKNNNLIQGCEVMDQGDNLILKVPSKRVFKITRRPIEVDGTKLNELFITEITALYKATAQLHEENSRLQRMNDRMRNLNDTITRVTIEKEILSLKIKVHDNIGKILLAAKRFFVSREGKISDIVNMWRESARLIAANDDPLKRDEYGLMFKTARDVGVNIKVTGMLPQDQSRKRIVATAMHECITNTIRHAGGDELYINTFLSDMGKRGRNTMAAVYMGPMVVEFTNNGNPPEGKIVLSGGLDMLKSMVEDYGGEMVVQSEPVFKLIIRM